MELGKYNIQRALDYIEVNLTDELDIRDIAAQVFLSPFYFQRIFRAVCRIGVGEYIRNRRLSRAAEDLLRSNANVIDIAAKYGYASPDSFRRAFVRYHGVCPSSVRNADATCKSFPPIRLEHKQKENLMLEYTIMNKAAFRIKGIARTFRNEDAYKKIPEFWDEVMPKHPLTGKYGVCLDSEDQNAEFVYMIADDCAETDEVPNRYLVRTIPAATWAVFPCKGPLPESLQRLNTAIWTQWLPECREYKLSMNITVEMYAAAAENPEDTYCEIWIPVTKF